MVWANGTVLQSGQYVIKRVLGKGGFGITYLARSKNDDLVVLKVLKDEFLQRPNVDKFKQDFQAEAECLKKFSHPNIVQIKNFFYDESGLPCLVLEYIDGPDLAVYLEDHGVLKEQIALQYMQQIGDVLHLIHEAGLLHRDIKPQNIVLRKQNTEAVLIDFGIARNFTPDITQSHTQMVSDSYSPLEQYHYKSKRGAYTDIYSLSATLYTLLTGKWPIPATIRTIGEEFTSPKSLNPTISDRVNNAILFGMALNPKNRPQSIYEWFRAMGLETTIDGRTDREAIDERITDREVIDGRTTDRVTINEDLKTVLVAPGRDFRERERRDRVDRQDKIQDKTIDTVYSGSEVVPESLETAFKSSNWTPLDHQSTASTPLILQRETTYKLQDFIAQIRKYFLTPTLGYLGIGIFLFVVMTEGTNFLKRHLIIQQSTQELQELKALMIAGDYDECLVQTSQVSPESYIYGEAIALLNQCSQRILDQANSKYDQRKIIDGMAIASKVPESSKHYQAAQSFIDKSYVNVVGQAREWYEESGELEQAINRLRSINLKRFQGKVEETISTWRAEWNKNKQLSVDAQREFDQKNWELAKTKADSVTTPYWKGRVKLLIEQTNLEIDKEKVETQRTLAQACTTAKLTLEHNLEQQWDLFVYNVWEKDMSNQSPEHHEYYSVPPSNYPSGRPIDYTLVIVGPKMVKRLHLRQSLLRGKREPEIDRFLSSPQSLNEVTKVITACHSIGAVTFLGTYETGLYARYEVLDDGTVQLRSFESE